MMIYLSSQCRQQLLQKLSGRRMIKGLLLIEQQQNYHYFKTTSIIIPSIEFRKNNQIRRDFSLSSLSFLLSSSSSSSSIQHHHPILFVTPSLIVNHTFHNFPKINRKILFSTTTASSSKNDTDRNVDSSSSSNPSSNNTTSNSTTNNTTNDYLTNDGIIEGVWMFCRHGDRTPSRSLVPEHYKYEEGNYWITTLPSNIINVYETLCQYYPIIVHPPPNIPNTIKSYSLSDPIYQSYDNNYGRYIDSTRYPFGYLTDIGLQQLCENGRRYYNRYNYYGHHQDINNRNKNNLTTINNNNQDNTSSNNKDNNNQWIWNPNKSAVEQQKEFFDVWDLQVYSTNYLRTIMSVQSFLDGMLGTDCYHQSSSSSSSNNNNKNTTETLDNNSNHHNSNNNIGTNDMIHDSNNIHQENQQQYRNVSTTTKPKGNNRLSRLPDHSWPVKAIIATPELNRIGHGKVCSRYHIHHNNPDINNNDNNNNKTSNNNDNESHSNHSVHANTERNPTDHQTSSSSFSSSTSSNSSINASSSINNMDGNKMTMNHQQQHSKKRNKYLVPIQVRNLKNDPLNAFDRNPELIAQLVSEVIQSDEFLRRDSAAAPVAARLANILPGLVRKKKQPLQQQQTTPTAVAVAEPPLDENNSTTKHDKRYNLNSATTTLIKSHKTSDYTSKTPSGINWVEAADHFVCRTAHDVKLAKFSDYENEDHIEQTLQAMSYQTITHLSWRFRQWYQHKRLLAAIAAPVLREVVNQMQGIPYLTKHDQQRPFVIYSCHDVTILGILYALGAEFLADDDGSDWRYWPPYGSSLVFELVRIDKNDNHNQHQQHISKPETDSILHHDNNMKNRRIHNNDDDNSTDHVIRILLNGKPIVTVDLEKTNKSKIPHYTGNGPQRMLRITDFETIISNLESDGGHDYKSLLSL